MRADEFFLYPEITNSVDQILFATSFRALSQLCRLD